MEKQVDKKFTWVIKNFSSLQSEKIYSDPFVIGGCKWRLLAFPKGNKTPDHLSLYLEVPGFKSLPSGWRRHAKCHFTIVNQIHRELSLVRETQHWFEEKQPDRGFAPMYSLTELNAKNSEFLANGELKIVAEVNVLEVVGRFDVLEESMDANGFRVLPSQVEFVKCLFNRYPDIASNVTPKNPHLKTGYMNVLLSLTEFLRQSPETISKEALAHAYAALRSLTDTGFKLDWLEKKLDEVSEKKEKEKACKTRMQEIEAELKEFKQKCSDLETVLEKEEGELLAIRAPVSCDDIY